MAMGLAMALLWMTPAAATAATATVYGHGGAAPPRPPPAAADSPLAVGRRAAASFVAHPNYTQPGCASCCFFCYNYGSGVIFDGINELDAAGMLSPTQAAYYRAAMDAKMDEFLRTPGKTPHDVLSGAQPAPPAKDYGDCGDMWLWGITYLTRAERRPGYNGGLDQRLATELGTNFSIGCRDRLPDSARTYARPSGGDAWPAPSPSPQIVWADGSFMGMVLPARLARQGRGAWAASAAGVGWIEGLVTMHLDGYRKYLRDPQDNLYRHGYNLGSRIWG